MDPLIPVIVGFLGGGAVGSIITHSCTRNRESANRRRDFRKFLGEWLHDIQRVPGGDTKATYDAYLVGARELAGYIAKLKGDFWLWWVFRRKCAPLLDRLPEHIHNRDGDCRLIIANPIGDLLSWV